MMKSFLRAMIPLSAVAVFSVATFAQDAPPPPPDVMAQETPVEPGPGGPGFRHMELLGIGGFHGSKVVTGAPFTATAVTTFSHTLADGNKISNTRQVTLSRDSQGRFRKEGSMPPVGDLSVEHPHSFIVIRDPVASKGYLLNPDKKVAHVMDMNGRDRGPKGREADAPAASDALESNEASNPNVTKESLGTQSINGISAQGTRYTRVIPAGKIGNDKPLTVTREVWYSPDLQMVVQSKHSDPRFGDTTYSLTNIQRNEPAANLFIVPSDYTIKEGGPHPGLGVMRRHGPQQQAAPADASPAPTL